MKAELIAAAAICAAIVGIAAWGNHHKNAADELRGELAACALRAMNAEAAIAKMEQEAQARSEAAAKALEAAQKDADKYRLRADKLLKQPAAVPGDDCASAKVRARAWLEGRK